MNIQGIELFNFMSHKFTSVQLPKKGIVLVTGSNGSGKSSLIEAVAVAVFGKTLRGTNPWQPDVVGHVSVMTDQVTTTRNITKSGTVRSSWAHMDARTDAQFDTNTKAQDALSKVVGDIDVWRRTHVFSSQDAAHFTMATDAQRKILLETILGLECFDVALTKAKAELAAMKSKLDKITVDGARAQERVFGATRSLQFISSTAIDEEPQELVASFDESAVAAVQQQMATLASEYSGVEDLWRTYRDDAVRHQMRMVHASAELQRYERDIAATREGQCPTCNRPWNSPEHQAELVQNKDKLELDAEAFTEAADKAKSMSDAYARTASSIEKQMAVLDSQLGEMRLARQAHKEWQGRHESWRIRRDSYLSKVEQAKLEVVACEEREGQLAKSHAVATREVRTLTEVVEVLGIKGVRAHVLGNALGGIEAVANTWLTRLAQTPMKLMLRSYSESATGAVQDKISLEVAGAGGGYGYKAASGGERRRIDAAMLLALAEVSAAAYGRAPGTLFFDEVFDSLDSDGVDAIGEALSDLAADRCVILITHSESLASRIPAAMRLKIADGKVQ